jgi:4-hydroxy-3-methylbut-2-enyl diphosphate reductase
MLIRADLLGFCMGVRRAVDLACGQDFSCRVYTYGPLIHNPRALEDLKRRGIKTIEEHNLPPDLNGAVIIIRAHGVSPQVEAELREKGARIIDATCPRVKASQLKAAAFAKAGCRLFLAGEENHAEIVGIRAYAGGNTPRCVVVGNTAEAEAAACLLSQECDAKTALIGQTTISEEEYRAIGETLKTFFPDIEIVQTICAATKERQDSLRELLDKVDAIIIAGGKESSNTRRLLAIAESANKPCIIAESPADIPPEFFKFKTIGLAAGASTPYTVVDEIEGVFKTGYLHNA